jgi:hypothetical protein
MGMVRVWLRLLKQELLRIRINDWLNALYGFLVLTVMLGKNLNSDIETEFLQ